MCHIYFGNTFAYVITGPWKDITAIQNTNIISIVMCRLEIMELLLILIVTLLVVLIMILTQRRPRLSHAEYYIQRVISAKSGSASNIKCANND